MVPLLKGVLCSCNEESLYDSSSLAGIGYTMVLRSACTGIYYNVVIAWALRYLIASCQTQLPWSGCDHPWISNDENKKLRECRSSYPLLFWQSLALLRLFRPVRKRYVSG